MNWMCGYNDQTMRTNEEKRSPNEGKDGRPAGAGLYKIEVPYLPVKREEVDESNGSFLLLARSLVNRVWSGLFR